MKLKPQLIDQLRDQLRRRGGDRLQDQIDDQLIDQLWGQFRWPFWDKLCNQIGIKLWGRLQQLKSDET